MKYDYMEQEVKDVLDYIEDEVDLKKWEGRRSELETYLNDTLLTEDSVTGKASGRYTFSAYDAERCICHNLDLLAEACAEFGIVTVSDLLKNGAESLDVAIRCYLLSDAIREALDHLGVEDLGMEEGE